jgi:hypothetical protein
MALSSVRRSAGNSDNYLVKIELACVELLPRKGLRPCEVNKIRDAEHMAALQTPAKGQTNSTWPDAPFGAWVQGCFV